MSVNVGESSVIDDIDTPEDYSRVSNGASFPAPSIHKKATQ